MGLLIAILVLMLLNTVWPRSTTLSKESLEGITQVADSMKKAADNWEKIAVSTNAVQEILTAQAQGRQNEINSLHAQLLGKYGLDPSDPFSGYVNSLLQQSQGWGGGDVPGGEIPRNQDKYLQNPNAGTPPKTDPGSKGTYHNGNGATPELPK